MTALLPRVTPLPQGQAHDKATLSLHAFLTRLIWLCLAPLIVIAAYLAIDNVRRTGADRDLQASILARNLAMAIDQHLLARIGALHMLAESPFVDQPAQWKYLYQEAHGFYRSFGSHVIFADTEMRMLFNTRSPFGSRLPLLPRPKGHAAAPTALATGKPAVGDILFGPVAKEPLVAIAVPVLREDKAAFLILSTFETRQFQARLDQVVLPSGWSLKLVDGEKDVIARRGPAGFDSASDVDPAGRFTVMSAVSPWSVVLEIPRNAYSAPLLSAGISLSLAILGAILASFMGGMLASRRLGGSVASLANRAARGISTPAIVEIARVRDLLDEAEEKRDTAEAAQRESQERLQLFILHAPASLAMFDRDMRYLAVSRRWMDDYSLGKRDILGCSHYDVFPEIPERWREIHRRGLAGEVIRADEDRFERADGSEQWLRWEILPWHTNDGEVGGIVIFSEDITRYKQAREEILNLNATLEQRVAERTAELTAANQELDSFAYAVSHDLRAPLRAMGGFSQALQEDYGSGLEGEAKVYLQQIDIASRKMGDLIDGILTLSRSTRGKLQRDAIDISALATRQLEELARGAPARPVKWEVEPGLAAVGDSRMIEAVLGNLLGNAWKYTGRTAQPVIRVFKGDVDGQPGFCVADNGAGFDMAHAERLFQPFQRLHRQDEFPGTGIGLATVQRIIHRHGGRICARGQSGAGATFCFTLAGTGPKENS